MNSRLIYILILSLFCGKGFSQMRDDAISLQAKYLIKDSLIEFTVSVFNQGSDSIGLYTKDRFDYGDKKHWPNCFFIQKAINGIYFNLFPGGTSQHIYSSDIVYLQKQKNYKFEIAFPIRKVFSPFESGDYSITFQISYLKRRKEHKIESESLFFSIH